MVFVVDDVTGWQPADRVTGRRHGVEDLPISLPMDIGCIGFSEGVVGDGPSQSFSRLGPGIPIVGPPTLPTPGTKPLAVLAILCRSRRRPFSNCIRRPVGDNRFLVGLERIVRANIHQAPQRCGAEQLVAVTRVSRILRESIFVQQSLRVCLAIELLGRRRIGV
jgi:hypothetical protein